MCRVPERLPHLLTRTHASAKPETNREQGEALPVLLQAVSVGVVCFLATRALLRLAVPSEESGETEESGDSSKAGE